jgi:NTE family protein
LPIGVAKKMGADIIIAVDVSENFSEELNVNSYFVVMGQLVNILMRKNANESIATLSDKDILLTPNLEGFGGLDANKYTEIIQRGVEVANKEYSTKLKHLSVNEAQYASYRQKHRYKELAKEIVVDKIEINNKTNVNNDLILSKISLKEGDKLDKEKLRSEILSIYNTGEFDSINYEVIKKEEKNILQLNATPSWNENGEINFSLGFEDDFSGHSSYSIKAGYTMFGLNSYGGEWKNDFEIGKDKRVYTELFQPLNASKEYYIKGSLLYHDRNEYISQTSSVNSGDFALNIERYGGSAGIGTYIFTNIALELGVSAYRDELEVKLLNASTGYDAVPIYASLNMDTLDNLNFPNSGVKSQIKWIKEDPSIGSDYDFEQIYIDFQKPISFGKHNITAYIKYGDTYKQNGVESVASNFSLGGLFNLSGIASNYLNGENMFLAVMKYRYRIEDGGFFGSLSARVYAGLSVEIGDAWRESKAMNYDNMRKAGSVYLAADTILGPFYLAYGHADSSDSTVYLYLGERF